MPYFLDGNNLIGSERRTRTPAEEDRAALEGELAARLRGMRSSVSVFYDGPPGRTRSLGALTIRQPGGSADDAILREMARARDPGQVTVVTADRALAGKARDGGAKTLEPAEFWKRFGQASGKRGAGPTPAHTKVDVEEWIRYFSDPENRKT